MKLKDQTVIVTGAAVGIGAAIATRFVREGANVVLADIQLDKAQALAESLQDENGQALALQTDVSRGEDIERMVAAAREHFGGLDILVNNAGVMDRMEPVGHVTDERWDFIWAVNTTAVMRAMRAVIPHFQKQQRGVIVNVASTAGLNGGHAGAAYTASKHAVVGLTKNTAFMYVEDGIRCNAIAPGGVETPMVAGLTNLDERGGKRQALAMPLAPRFAQPEEIAAVALFLATDESSFLNGAIVKADGGFTAAF